MKTLITSLCILIILITNTSCKKCRVCECKKGTEVTEQRNCAYGGGSSNESLETWERYLKEEQGYDDVTCHDEK
jgi:hypothetical protein